MKKSKSTGSDKDMSRLQEMVLDHLGLPRPGTNKHVQEIQDKLLPAFVETARYAWLAASPMARPGSPSYTYLQAVTETHPRKIQTLTEILEDLGVYDLLRDVSESSQVAMLSSIPLDPYEARLLREAGHPKPAKSAQEYLRLAAKDPKLLSLADEKLEEAGQISLSVHGDINTIINIQQEPPDNPSALPANPTAKKPKKRKLFTGLGALFSGVVLVSGNALMISTVPFAPVAALPVLGSLAGGFAAVGKGIGELRGEGE